MRIGDTTYAVPIASVRGVGRISATNSAPPTPATATAAKTTRCTTSVRCSATHRPPWPRASCRQMPLLLIRAGDLRAAVLVDQVVGNREIVVKPVGPQVASLPASSARPSWATAAWS